jgi:hypothetical protein
MVGFAGFGFATFSVGMKVGQIVEAAWWKGKLQEARTLTREPPPSSRRSLVRERRELDDGPLRPVSLLCRPRLSGGQSGLQRLNVPFEAPPGAVESTLPAGLQ